MSRQEIKDRLVVLLGGRVAEEATVGEISTGAQDDLLNATDLARRMVRELGMSDSLGLSSFEPRLRAGAHGVPWGGGAHDYSDETARAVDAEVARILGEAQERARAMLAERRVALERIAQRLLEVETLSGDELRALVVAPDARFDVPSAAG
jgi:cell division protease FtsH